MLRMSDIIVAATIAVAGVVATQISLHIVEAVKAKRDKTKEIDARKFSLKREMYIGAVASFNEAMDFMNRIPGADHASLGDFKASPESQRAMATLALGSSTRVQGLVWDAGKLGADCLLKMVSLKTREQFLLTEHNRLSSQVTQLGERAKQITINLQAFDDLKADSDSQERGQLLEEAKWIQSEFEATLSKLAALQEERMGIVRDFAQIQREDIPGLARNHLEAVIAMREDLGIPTDAAEMRRLLSNSIGEGVEIGEVHLAKLWELFGLPKGALPELRATTTPAA